MRRFLLPPVLILASHANSKGMCCSTAVQCRSSTSFPPGIVHVCPPFAGPAVSLQTVTQLWGYISGNDASPNMDLLRQSTSALPQQLPHILLDCREGSITRRVQARLPVEYLFLPPPSASTPTASTQMWSRSDLVNSLLHGCIVPYLLLHSVQLQRRSSSSSSQVVASITLEECLALFCDEVGQSLFVPGDGRLPMVPPYTPAVLFAVDLSEEAFRAGVQQGILRTAAKGGKKRIRSTAYALHLKGGEHHDADSDVLSILSWQRWCLSILRTLPSSHGNSGDCWSLLTDTVLQRLQDACASNSSGVLTISAHRRLREQQSRSDLRGQAEALVHCVFQPWIQLREAPCQVACGGPRAELLLSDHARVELLTTCASDIRAMVSRRPRGVAAQDAEAATCWPVARALLRVPGKSITDMASCSAGLVVEQREGVAHLCTGTRLAECGGGSPAQITAFLGLTSSSTANGDAASAGTSHSGRSANMNAQIEQSGQPTSSLYDVVLDNMPSLPIQTELAMVVALSSILRKRIEKIKKQQDHLLTAAGKGDATSTTRAVADLAASNMKETHAELLRMGASLSSKYTKAHPAAGHVIGLYLLYKWKLVCSLPSSVHGIRTLEEAVQCWESEVAHMAAVPSPRESKATHLLMKCVSQQYCPAPHEMKALWEDYVEPLLCTSWGIEKGIHGVRLMSSSSSFKQHALERVEKSITWAMLESSLQLGRIKPDANAELLRAALKQFFVQDSATTVPPHAAEEGDSLLFQLSDGDSLICLTPTVRQTVTQLCAPSPSTGAEINDSSTAAPLPVLPSPVQQTPPVTVPLHKPFEALLADVIESKELDRVVNLAQSVIRVVFNVLIPALSTSISGRRYDHLQARVRWHRYQKVLGPLDAFLIAFEGFFFTICRSVGDGMGSIQSATIGSDASPCGGEAAALLSPYDLVSLQSGHVGPWQVYGGLIAKFFPAHLRVPLRAVAEAVSWGLHFSPRFGDLPSLLRAVGREVQDGALLPLPAAQADSQSVLQYESLWWATISKMVQEVQAMPGNEDHPSKRDAYSFTDAQLQAALDAHHDRQGGRRHHFRELVRDLIVSSPLLFQWSAQDGGALLVRLQLPGSCYDEATHLVETYVCPHLRHAVPLCTEEVAACTAWGTSSSSGYVYEAASAKQTGSGGLCVSPTTVSLFGLLWIYTAASPSQPLNSSNNDEQQQRCLWHMGNCDSEARTTRTWGSIKMDMLTHAPTGGAAFVLSPTGSYISPQDHLLVVNKIAVVHEKGVDVRNRALTVPTLSPTEKPLSLMEVVSERNALADNVRANRKALLLDDDKQLEEEEAAVKEPCLLSVAWLPGGETSQGDIIIWKS